jgi:hypothetical protein
MWLRTCSGLASRRGRKAASSLSMSAQLSNGLWLESMAHGRPLSFLENRIKCGNSLLGATPAAIALAIPDEAFAVLSGDDKAVV